MTERKCPCKGIRSCAICCPNVEPSGPVADERPHCWQCLVQVVDNCLSGDAHIGGTSVVENFITEAEEDRLRKAIDGVPWIPSQSGRCKQDYGPKVNFKKKKLKLDGFSGLPPYIAPVVNRFNELEALKDFRTAEMCCLEYTAERRSSIDAHLDDSWLWGERLVTLNLLEQTAYTMAPVGQNSPTG